MMADIRSILACNSKAVGMMTSGDYAAAADLLGSAIAEVQKMDEILLDQTEVVMSDDEDETVMAEPLHFPQVKLQVVPILASPHLRTQESVSPYFLYRGAMEIFSSQNCSETTMVLEEDDDQSESRCGLLSSALFYNLGLCCQLLALTHGKHREHLPRALLAYQTALGLVDEQTDELSVILLELALHNNLGHIHNSLCETALTESCLERMRLVFFDVTDGGDEPIPDSLACFFSNTVHNESLFDRHAPAA